MKLTPASLNLIEAAINKAIGKFNNSNQTVVTDIHIQPNQRAGMLYVWDDEDLLLAETAVTEWETYEEEDFYSQTERILQSLLMKMKEEGAMESLSLLKPYSFVLVDEERETIAELLLMDDDTVLVNEELLKGLDEELDAFLQELLEK